MLEVNENEEVELQCKVADAKPAAEVRWFKNDIREEDGEEKRYLLRNIASVERTLSVRKKRRDSQQDGKDKLMFFSSIFLHTGVQ